MKVLLLNIDKHLCDLVLPRIIINYGGRTTFEEVFTIVKQCDRVLCQHDATNLVSLLVDISKTRKTLIATTSLAEVEGDKTLYCWSCRQSSHTKKNCPLKQK